MSIEDPLYLSRQQLAEAAGVSIRTFEGHVKQNVGGLNDARETHPGIGTVYVTRKCRKYLALTQAFPKRRKNRTQPIITTHAAI